MVACLVAETGNVVTVKFAQYVPAGIFTTAGTWTAEGSLLESVTPAPPGGALPFRKIVPGMGLPPSAPPTLSDTDSNAGGAFGSACSSTKKVFVTPPALASMRTEVMV